MNKKKIINDPVHGFISIPTELIFDLIQHPFFQRLRRIRQLGLSDLTYPGALHTRFHHALGAMHLMSLALDTLRQKGFEISEEEVEGAQIAILLHDIGHGPFSHTLEFSLLKDIHHEDFSQMIMQELNKIFGGKLQTAIEIFTDTYPRRFLHQLVSSQLDMDRMDYLLRDSFFTGVVEGKIGADRIIKMLTLQDENLLVEEKGIYSIENFLTARRLMYWQVYLHKTNIAAEQMLIRLLTRAKRLHKKGKDIFWGKGLEMLIDKSPTARDFAQNSEYLYAYLSLDDYDIWACIKVWQYHPDFILSTLSKMLLERKLFKLHLSSEPIGKEEIKAKKEKIMAHYGIKSKHLHYFMVSGTTSNEAYLAKGDKINILTKKGEIKDIAQASDLPNIKALRKIVKKYYLCWANY